MKNIPKRIYLNEDDMEFTFPTVSFDRIERKEAKDV